MFDYYAICIIYIHFSFRFVFFFFFFYIMDELDDVEAACVIVTLVTLFYEKHELNTINII